jgi:hypothetical protein
MKISSYTITRESQIDKEVDARLDSPQTAVFVFGGAKSFRNKKEIFEKLAKKFPHSHIIGCSSAGEIFQTNVYDDSLSIAVAQFDGTALTSVALPIASYPNADALGKDLANKVNQKGLAGVFVLSEGIHINGSELIKGITSVLPQQIAVSGGLAGDGAEFKQTWTLHNGKLLDQHVVALGFIGDDIKVSHGTHGGWDKFGPKRLVTRSQGNVLYELDGEPALDLYKKYLGERAVELPSAALLFPLLIEENGTVEKTYVRTVLSIDEKEKTMTFAGDMPQGSQAQFMKANLDRLVDSASTAAKKIKNLASDTSTLAIAISCVGRRLVLKDRIEEEVESTMGFLPSKNTTQVGFYSYGELSPLVQGKPCELHNQTMTLTVLQETKRKK